MSQQREGGITWTDATWNPIRGCSRVSEGCRNCYAERTAFRYSAPGMAYEGLVRVNHVGIRQPQWNGTVRVVDEHMLDPLRWRRPRRIFVNSMSDLFHENVADETIDRIFAVMALCPQHSFQVLTKRPMRMLEYLATHPGRLQAVWWTMASFDVGLGMPCPPWPLPNVWLGVSVEHQAAADERIPLLLETPAAVRWISAEPLLGPINLLDMKGRHPNPLTGVVPYRGDGYPKLDWVVVGGESGPGARPMEEAWARSLRDQCVAAEVAFHFKQWGEWLPAMCDGALIDGTQHLNCSDAAVRMGKHKSGRLLDGRVWDEYPEVRA